MRKRIPRCHFFGTELSRVVRSHSQARLKARLGMGPDSPGQLCPEEWQHGILLVPASQIPFPGEPSDEPGQLCTEEMTAWDSFSIKLLQIIRTKTSFDQFCIRFIRIYRLLWSSARVPNELLTNHRRDIKTQGEGHWTWQGWIYPMFDVIRHIFTFSHTSDIPPCREQLWDKSISHGFHDLKLCTVYLAWLKCIKVQSMRENAFCMVFHVRWISHHSSPNPTLVDRYATRAGFGDSWWEKSISHGKPYKMHIIPLQNLRHSKGEKGQSCRKCPWGMTLTMKTVSYLTSGFQSRARVLVYDKGSFSYIQKKTTAKPLHTLSLTLSHKFLPRIKLLYLG